MPKYRFLQINCNYRMKAAQEELTQSSINQLKWRKINDLTLRLNLPLPMTDKNIYSTIYSSFLQLLEPSTLQRSTWTQAPNVLSNYTTKYKVQIRAKQGTRWEVRQCLIRAQDLAPAKTRPLHTTKSVTLQTVHQTCSKKLRMIHEQFNHIMQELVQATKSTWTHI